MAGFWSMGGESPPLESGERRCWKVERSCGGGRTGLPYLCIAVMEELNEL